jgi:hypothetical protein
MIITSFVLLLMFLKKNYVGMFIQSIYVMPRKEEGLVVLVCTGTLPDLSTVVRHCDRTEMFSRMTLLHGVS